MYFCSNKNTPIITFCFLSTTLFIIRRRLDKVNVFIKTSDPIEFNFFSNFEVSFINDNVLSLPNVLTGVKMMHPDENIILLKGLITALSEHPEHLDPFAENSILEAFSKGQIDSKQWLIDTIIDNNFALYYLHEENVSSDDINDFHLKEAGKFVGANIVIYGYAYTFDVPFKYSPTTSDALSIGELWENEYSDAWTDLFFALGKSLVVGGQLSNRQKAITDAGTYVKLTYYAINIDTGKKVFITKNMTVLKIG